MPNQDTIRERADKLWDMAGNPYGNDFLEEAQRQLAEERARHELKTPDNL
jgi:hypothetical protein